MEKVEISYFGYQLVYFFQPGKWMQDQELESLRHDLTHVNRSSGKNFSYGVFSPQNDINAIRELLSRTNLCIMKLGSEPVGFFYNYVIQEKVNPMIHAGLVLITNNTGVDLLTGPYIYMALLQRKKYGSFYYTNISSTPAIVGSFGEMVTRAWPSHRSRNLKRPPQPIYHSILDRLYSEYVLRFFPHDGIQLDRKRFVIRSSSSDMGFETNLRRLSRHPQLKVNLFCQFWLDYSQGEDLVQIGWCGYRFHLKALAVWSFLRWQRMFISLKESLWIFRET